MQINEIMTLDVEVIRPDAPISEAAEKMKNLDVGPLPVCDGQRLVGMVTDRDIVLRAVAEGRDPNTTKVEDVMSPQVAYCFEDQRVEEAAQMMEARQIRRLPILDREKQLVGIVSLGDIAIGTRDEQLAGQVLEEVSAPSGVR
jgi:CBS domain-containing protein